jgi:hypothetical protein
MYVDIMILCDFRIVASFDKLMVFSEEPSDRNLLHAGTKSYQPCSSCIVSKLRSFFCRVPPSLPNIENRSKNGPNENESQF